MYVVVRLAYPVTLTSQFVWRPDDNDPDRGAIADRSIAVAGGPKEKHTIVYTGEDVEDMRERE